MSLLWFYDTFTECLIYQKALVRITQAVRIKHFITSSQKSECEWRKRSGRDRHRMSMKSKPTTHSVCLTHSQTQIFAMPKMPFFHCHAYTFVYFDFVNLIASKGFFHLIYWTHKITDTTLYTYFYFKDGKTRRSEKFPLDFIVSEKKIPHKKHSHTGAPVKKSIY